MIKFYLKNEKFWSALWLRYERARIFRFLKMMKFRLKNEKSEITLDYVRIFEVFEDDENCMKKWEIFTCAITAPGRILVYYCCQTSE